VDFSYIYVRRERSWCFAVNNLLVYSKHKPDALNIYGTWGCFMEAKLNTYGHTASICIIFENLANQDNF